MLKSITVQKLRGIKKCTIEDLDEVNILIGKNGAGKSTVLEAIYLASAWVEPRDELRNEYKADYIISRRFGRGSWQQSRNVLWFVTNTDEDIEMEIRFNNEKHLKFKIPYFVGDSKISIWLNGKWEEYDGYNFAENALLNSRLRVYYPSLEKIREKFSEEEIKFLRNITLIDYNFLSQPKYIEERIWPKLLQGRLDKLIISMIKQGFEPEAEDLTYIPIAGNYALALKLPKTVIRVDDLGDGARSAILLASALTIVKNTVALIEDPETHQHPGGLSTIMDFALKMTKENRLQLIITTHSIELVNIMRRLCEKNNLKLKLFFLDRDNNGVVDVRTLESIDVDILAKLGLDPRLLHII